VLLTAAVVPGPPALVAELMGSAAHELDDLRRATGEVVARALSDLLAASADPQSSGPAPDQASGSASVQLVVVGPGEPGEFDPAGPVSFAGFGRDVVVPALVEGRRTDGELPTPIMVARYLASRDLAAHPEHAELWASARWVTTRGSDAAALGDRLRAPGSQVALILVADGATCHGPKAPRAEDTRAQGYDDEACQALASGQPDRLARVDRGLGDALGATGQQVWPVLVAAAGGDMVGEVAWAGAPYGVGWAVASWRRP
jgi:hypothetical protein